MRFAVAGLLLAVLTAAAPAVEPAQGTVILPPPTYPSPLRVSILGLTITAIAVVGARASQRSSDTMMYMVLASLAVTAVMVAYSDKVHADHLRARIEYLQQLGKPPAS